MRLLVDGDGCPRDVRSIILKAAEKRNIETLFFADRGISGVSGAHVTLVLVPPGEDSADDRMCEEASPGDIAVTRDIPLASRLVEQGVEVLNTDGSLYSRENIRERLSIRNAMTELRSMGVMDGKKGRKRSEAFHFANAFDRLLQQRLGGR